MSNDENQGVFNFDVDFPGPHMIRLRLDREHAWKVVRELLGLLEVDRESLPPTVALFGTMKRDSEEDRGLPIEIETAEKARGK